MATLQSNNGNATHLLVTTSFSIISRGLVCLAAQQESTQPGHGPGYQALPGPDIRNCRTLIAPPS
jgi:hypothetical protein